MPPARKTRKARKPPPSDKSRLRVMRKRRGLSLHSKIIEYGELFGLDVIMMARDKASGKYEVFEPHEDWPAPKDIKRTEDVGGNFRVELQRMEKLVKGLKVPEPPRPLCTRS
ncbi:uncharacterized protein PG998_000781 [Apiospora kogelbergensis]|uniref:uncharacterized protein n=1 Tax=Apiospora kogelbergensis TaxID=1337665 RepID=UPI003132350A